MLHQMQALPRIKVAAPGTHGVLNAHRSRQRVPCSILRGSSSTRTAIAADATPVESNVEKDVVSLACPICQLTRLDVGSEDTGSLECSRCSRSFDRNARFTDMTLTSGMGRMIYTEKTPTMTSNFENPLVSLVYERGWRQSFARAGFPGEAKEFSDAMEYLKPARGGVVMDLSCGSGLFTRRFAASGQFSQVVAVDYSESMLEQTHQYIQRGGQRSRTPIFLVRADVARLPFISGSIPAIHAGEH